MSDGATTPEAPTAYEYASHVTLECPKCGLRGSFPFSKRQKSAIEYAGVCDTVLEEGRWCGAVLNVQVTTHVFPA